MRRDVNVLFRWLRGAPEPRGSANRLRRLVIDAYLMGFARHTLFPDLWGLLLQVGGRRALRLARVVARATSRHPATSTVGPAELPPLCGTAYGPACDDSGLPSDDESVDEELSSSGLDSSEYGDSEDEDDDDEEGEEEEEEEEGGAEDIPGGGRGLDPTPAPSAGGLGPPPLDASPPARSPSDRDRLPLDGEEDDDDDDDAGGSPGPARKRRRAATPSPLDGDAGASSQTLLGFPDGAPARRRRRLSSSSSSASSASSASSRASSAWPAVVVADTNSSASASSPLRVRASGRVAARARAGLKMAPLIASPSARGRRRQR
ncbi:regulatory protein ICP22 [Saimiriine alphaherpesvirus 1]|nr:regulatory protein ICP22 [Saimiriine alphaherpesvirus 1]ADO13840.1 regulatory protein ICP22 [Saimiriine alphaherpesvirus 1]